MKPEPVDIKLYQKIKKQIYKKYPVHSAYRSGLLVKNYKEEFAKIYGTRKKPYKGKKPTKKGLTRWFLEDWKSNTGEYKYTNKNSVYRPTKRITSQTPLTFSELSKKELEKAKKEKSKKGRIYRFREKNN